LGELAAIKIVMMSTPEARATDARVRWGMVTGAVACEMAGHAGVRDLGFQAGEVQG